MNFLRGSKEEFEKYNPVLEDGQPCFVRDLKTDDNDKETVFYGIKIGDGKNNWIDLPYIGNVNIDLEQVINHINNNDIHVTKEEKDKWNSFLQDISNKLDKDGDASKTYTNFETADERSNIESGDNLSLIFSKISKWFADMKTVSFTGDYNDLENKPEIPDKVTYELKKSEDDKTISLVGSDGSESNVNDNDTTYKIGTYEYGVSLSDSNKKIQKTPLNLYRKTFDLYFRIFNELVESDRGYLLGITGFNFISTFNRYDSSYAFDCNIDKVLDPSEQEDILESKIHCLINTDVDFIKDKILSSLSIVSNKKINIYAYSVSQPAEGDHDYYEFTVFIAIYCDDKIENWGGHAHLAVIQYTNDDSCTLASDKSLLDSCDISKLIKQEISKDTDTTYELIQYSDLHGNNPNGPIVSLKNSNGTFTETTVPRAMTCSSWDDVYKECYGNIPGNNKYASLVDIVYHYDGEYSTPVIIDSFLYVKYGAMYYDVHVNIHRTMFSDNESYAKVFPHSKLSSPNIDWTVLMYNTSSGYRVYRICVDQETMQHILDAKGSARLISMTSNKGELLGKAQRTAELDAELDKNYGDPCATYVILSSRNAPDVAFTGDYNDLSNKPEIPDKSKIVTHGANTAAGSATKPVYITENGVATPISHSINADVPANAKFTDTTYENATQSEHGLMTAADKKKLDAMDLSKYLPKSGGSMNGNINMAENQKDILVGTHRSTESFNPTAVAGGTVSKKLSLETGLTERRSLIGSWLDENNIWQNIISVRHRNGWNDGPNYGFYLRSLLTSNGSLFWNKQTGDNTWQGERVLLDSTNYSTYAAKSDHTHAMIVNSEVVVNGANANPMWVRLGTLVSSGNFYSASIRVWTGSGANGRASQNSSFEIQIKDGWQSTESAVKACGVTIYRINCSTVKVKVIPTAHNTYVVWVYMPWGYWNGNFEVRGKYKSWTPQVLRQANEPEGTAADTAYYDQAFKGSTVAKANTLVDSGWKKMSLGSYASSGEVSYRTYGKQITITGKVVLKTAIVSSPKVPQSIATTESLDFSNIKGCSGMGRSDAGSSLAVYFSALNYYGDNIVTSWSVGTSSIAAGTTLYFTITGFID